MPVIIEHLEVEVAPPPTPVRQETQPGSEPDSLQLAAHAIADADHRERLGAH